MADNKPKSPGSIDDLVCINLDEEICLAKRVEEIECINTEEEVGEIEVLDEIEKDSIKEVEIEKVEVARSETKIGDEKRYYDPGNMKYAIGVRVKVIDIQERPCTKNANTKGRIYTVQVIRWDKKPGEKIKLWQPNQRVPIHNFYPPYLAD